MNYTEFINSTPIVLVEFYATWCPHCQHMMPIVKQVTKQLDGKATVQQLDIDKYTELANKEKIETIPTFIIYQDGHEQWRHTGEIEGQLLLDKVEAYTR